MTNDLAGRILDDVVEPIRKLDVSKRERNALASLIFLDGDCRGLSPTTQDALSQAKDRVQSALFQYILVRCEQSLNAASSRFAKILLLLPSIAKVSAIYSENVDLAKRLTSHLHDAELATRLEKEKVPDIVRELVDASATTGSSLICAECASAEAFAGVHELEAHVMADHFDCTPYECEKCPLAKFSTEYLVREHCETAHRSSEYYIRYRVSQDIEIRREQTRKVLKMSISSSETVESKKDSTLTSGPAATNGVNGIDDHPTGSATRNAVTANVNVGREIIAQPLQPTGLDNTDAAIENTADELVEASSSSRPSQPSTNG